jgi:hypothetical protein
MAIPKIKATYSLDPETVGTLERLAREWKTSKSEALRRLISQGAEGTASESARKIAALRQLQKSVGLTTDAAEQWMKDVRAERRSRHIARPR